MASTSVYASHVLSKVRFACSQVEMEGSNHGLARTPTAPSILCRRMAENLDQKRASFSKLMMALPDIYKNPGTKHCNAMGQRSIDALLSVLEHSLTCRVGEEDGRADCDNSQHTNPSDLVVAVTIMHFLCPSWTLRSLSFVKPTSYAGMLQSWPQTLHL